MKTENTLQNKEKFFALYFGQEVLKMYREDIATYKITGDKLSQYQMFHEFSYLELYPLSAITHEDAVKLGYANPAHLKKNSSFNIDELRSLGYALSYMGMSVEKLIEYEWIKLKN